MDHSEYSAHRAAERVREYKLEGLNEILEAIDAEAEKGRTFLSWSSDELHDVQAVIQNLQGRHFKVTYKPKDEWQLHITWHHL